MDDNVSYFLDLLLIKMSNKDKGALEIHLAITRTMFRNTDLTLGIL